jgi:hypothetical protein
MQGNPFYVEPLGGYGPSIIQGLSGIGSIISAKQEEKRKQAEQAAAMQEARDVFSSNDPNRIAEFSLRNPSYAQQVSQAIKFKNDATKQNMTDSMRRILAGEILSR